MEYAYAITHPRITLYIAILNTSDLHLHEEIIPDLLDELVRSIELDGFLKHPIIVDKRSLVVLDGMHRVAALERLGCKRIPACLVDYENSAITVGCWYRALKGARALEHLNTQIKGLGLTIEEVRKIDDTKIGVSPIVAAVRNRKKAFLIRSPFRSLKEAYDIIRQIEGGLKEFALDVAYETELDALSKLRDHEADVVLLTPKVTKGSIINTALSGSVFSFKTTRHIIPARPLYLNVPLSLLRNGEKPISEVNNELRRMLQRKRLKHVAAGSILNGRRYEEDLYLFEE
jgi:hypothetical protein